MPNEWTKICAACAEGSPPERCAYYGEPGGCNAPKLGQHPDGNIAERLQEELEKAERRIAEMECAPGNVAGIRKALDKAESVLLVAARFATDNAFTGAEARENLRDVDWDGALAEIDAALAAPARNCDRPECATRDGSYNTWYRETWKMSREDCPDWSVWLFAPAEGGAEK